MPYIHKKGAIESGNYLDDIYSLDSYTSNTRFSGKTMRYLICALLLATLPLHAGTIKKWVDEDGNVHYGDSPPVSAKTENIRVLSAPSNPGKALPRLNDSASEDTASSGGGEDGNAGKVPADQAKEACDQAKDDLKVISSSSRIRLKAADGTTRYMTTEEIQDRKKQAEADIKQFCK